MRFGSIGVLLFLLTLSELQAGDISGRVVISRRLTRKVPAPANYDLRGAPVIVAPQPSTLEAEFERTVVILEGFSRNSKAPVTVTINQRETRFEPELVIVPVGSTVEFPNADPIFHNVFSLSGSKAFDLGYYPKGKSKAVKFDQAGVVQIYCHLHSNMYAAVVVTDQALFDKPAKDGSFHWANVPAGHYKVTVWHKVAGFYQGTVDVPEQGRADFSIQLPLDDLRNESKKNEAPDAIAHTARNQ